MEDYTEAKKALYGDIYFFEYLQKNGDLCVVGELRAKYSIEYFVDIVRKVYGDVIDVEDIQYGEGSFAGVLYALFVIRKEDKEN